MNWLMTLKCMRAAAMATMKPCLNKIDKMDSSAIRCPTRWRLLNTAIFRDGNRVEVRLLGSVWSGLHHSAPTHFAQPDALERPLPRACDNYKSLWRYGSLIMF